MTAPQRPARERRSPAEDGPQARWLSFPLVITLIMMASEQVNENASRGLDPQEGDQVAGLAARLIRVILATALVLACYALLRYQAVAPPKRQALAPFALCTVARQVDLAEAQEPAH